MLLSTYNQSVFIERNIMTAQIIDGKLISQTVRQEVAARVAARTQAGLRAPTLR